MRKLKVYLDTSVISYLMQEDVPEKMADTRQLWEMFKAEKYEVYLSAVTLKEIALFINSSQQNTAHNSS